MALLIQVRSNIPYQVIGGTPFWTRKEVKDLMAYVKLAISPEDDLSLMRAINQPTRGIGAESQTKLKAWAQGQGLSLGQALFPQFQVSLQAHGRACGTLCILEARQSMISRREMQALMLRSENVWVLLSCMHVWWPLDLFMSQPQCFLFHRHRQVVHHVSVYQRA